MFFDSDTIANRNRLLFGKQGRAGISFLFRIIPILMIAGQLKVDLSFLQLCLLQAENIGICRLKVFLKTFFMQALSPFTFQDIIFFIRNSSPFPDSLFSAVSVAKRLEPTSVFFYSSFRTYSTSSDASDGP